LSSRIPKLSIRSRTFAQSLRLVASNAIRSSVSSILTYFGENGKMAVRKGCTGAEDLVMSCAIMSSLFPLGRAGFPASEHASSDRNTITLVFLDVRYIGMN